MTNEIPGYNEVLVNEFTEANARKFREEFLAEARDPKKSIVIWIDSGGGSVDALATMVETIKSVPNKVITVCIGRANSCAAILLSFGNERYCGEYSRAMIHGFSRESNKVPMLEQMTDATEGVRIENFWLLQLALNCKMEGGLITLRQKIKDGEGRIWLDAKSAKDFGLVDFVGTPKIKSGVAYSVSR